MAITEPTPYYIQTTNSISSADYYTTSYYSNSYTVTYLEYPSNGHERFIKHKEFVDWRALTLNKKGFTGNIKCLINKPYNIRQPVKCQRNKRKINLQRTRKRLNTFFLKNPKFYLTLQ